MRAIYILFALITATSAQGQHITATGYFDSSMRNGKPFYTDALQLERTECNGFIQGHTPHDKQHPLREGKIFKSFNVTDTCIIIYVNSMVYGCIVTSQLGEQNDSEVVTLTRGQKERILVYFYDKKTLELINPKSNKVSKGIEVLVSGYLTTKL